TGSRRPSPAVLMRMGAGSGIRTHTSFRTNAFEAFASTVPPFRLSCDLPVLFHAVALSKWTNGTGTTWSKSTGRRYPLAREYAAESGDRGRRGADPSRPQGDAGGGRVRRRRRGGGWGDRGQARHGAAPGSGDPGREDAGSRRDLGGGAHRVGAGGAVSDSDGVLPA